MRFSLGWILALTLWNTPCSSAQTNTTRSDILIADFEGTSYGSWTATGDAFGPGPCAGRFQVRWPSPAILAKDWSIRSTAETTPPGP